VLRVWQFVRKRQHALIPHRIGGVMVSVITASVVDRGFESRSGQSKDYIIGICCFSAVVWRVGGRGVDWIITQLDPPIYFHVTVA
jgi:hypothetical protein